MELSLWNMVSRTLFVEHDLLNLIGGGGDERGANMMAPLIADTLWELEIH